MINKSIKPDQWIKKRSFWVFIGICGLSLVIFANIHLVYIAVTSQPECVLNQQTMDNTGSTFRAAKPSC